MYSKKDLLTLSDQVCSLNIELLVFNHCRFRSLLRRVKIVVNLIDANVSDGTTNSGILQTISLMHTTLSEISDYQVLFSIKNATLASHILKFGSDEEQFIKWNERLQHCVEELGLGDKLAVGDLVDDEKDYKDFRQDVAYMKPQLIDIVIILYNEGETETVVEYLQGLLGHQSSSRTGYKTKTAPNAALGLDSSKVKLDKVIGHGGFGVVWRATYKGEQVAVKAVPMKSLTRQSLAELDVEANIMRRLAHPRIVSCFGVFENDGHHCIMMELMDNGSLYDYIYEKPCPEGWESREDIALDICAGMSYLHNLNVIHRDLKPGNVVLDQFLRAKITDFGLSLIKTTAVTSVKGNEVGTVQYMAPECFGLAPLFSTKSDVYAFAIILWEIAHWKFAYKGVTAGEIKDSIRAGERMLISDSVPAEIAAIITTCWDRNPRNRSDFGGLANRLEAELTIVHLANPKTFRPYGPKSGNTLKIEETVGTIFGSSYTMNKVGSWDGYNANNIVPVPYGNNSAIIDLNNSKQIPSRAMKGKQEKSRHSKRTRLCIIFGIGLFIVIGIAAAVIMVYVVPVRLGAAAPNPGLASSSSTVIHFASVPGIVALSTLLTELPLVIPITYSNSFDRITTDTSWNIGPTSTLAVSIATSSTATTAISSTASFSTTSSAPNALTTTATSLFTTLANNAISTTSSNSLISASTTITTSTIASTTVAETTSLSCKTSNPIVSTFAGLSGVIGSTDGPLTSATFNYPSAIAFFPDGKLYITDSGSGTNRLRKIWNGNVTTPILTGEMVNTTTNTFIHYSGGQIAISNTGSIYVPFVGQTENIFDRGYVLKIDDGVSKVFAGNTSTVGSTDGNALTEATFFQIWSVRLDSDGNLYIMDSNNDKVRVVNNSVVSTFAGLGGKTKKESDFHNGPVSTATFGFSYDIALDNSGNLYVSEESSNTIRKISPVGIVSTLAGVPYTSGSGTGMPGMFNLPIGITTDRCGNVFVADFGANVIQMINATGYVSLVAGVPNSTGNNNGPGVNATFNGVNYLAFDEYGDLYVTEYWNHDIRKITFT